MLVREDRKFHLKPFSIFHHVSSMKAGMDSTLLGVWADVKETKSIIDIGTGCGILSLLLASKCDAMIDAVELDFDSAKEAGENFQNSAYFNRMRVHAIDINRFAQLANQKYDAIISNPPFFINDTRSQDSKKKQARHADSLNFDQIIQVINKLMKPDGKFFLVLPYIEGITFLKIAESNHLYLQRKQIIFPIRGLEPNRINMKLGFEQSDRVKTEKFIVREDNREFSAQYKQFLKDYLIGID